MLEILSGALARGMHLPVVLVKPKIKQIETLNLGKNNVIEFDFSKKPPLFPLPADREGSKGRASKYLLFQK